MKKIISLIITTFLAFFFIIPTLAANAQAYNLVKEIDLSSISVRGLAFDNSHHIFVLNNASGVNLGVKVYDILGNKLIDQPMPQWETYVEQDGIARDRSGNIYLSMVEMNSLMIYQVKADFTNNQLAFNKIIDWTGGNNSTIAKSLAVDNASKSYYVLDKNTIIKLPEAKTINVPNLSIQPISYMAVDSSGNLFVPVANNDSIQILDPSGTWQTAWSNPGNVTGEPAPPFAVGFDGGNNIYVGDLTGTPTNPLNGVQRFTSNRDFDTLVSSGSHCPQLMTVSNDEMVATFDDDKYLRIYNPKPAPTPTTLPVPESTTTTISTTTTTFNPISGSNITLGLQKAPLFNTATCGVKFYSKLMQPILPNPPMSFIPVRVLDKNGNIIINTATTYVENDPNPGPAGMVVLKGVHPGDRVDVSWWKDPNSLFLAPALWTKYYEFKLPDPIPQEVLVTFGAKGPWSGSGASTTTTGKPPITIKTPPTYKIPTTIKIPPTIKPPIPKPKPAPIPGLKYKY